MYSDTFSYISAKCQPFYVFLVSFDRAEMQLQGKPRFEIFEGLYKKLWPKDRPKFKNFY